jgi:hypothetical protein
MASPIFTTPQSTSSVRMAEEYEAPMMDVLAATAEDAWLYSPTSSIWRGLKLSDRMGKREIRPEILEITDPVERRNAMRSGDAWRLVPGTSKFVNHPSDKEYQYGTILSKEEAEQRVTDAGVKLTIPGYGITDAALNVLIERKREEMQREDVFSRAGGGFMQGAARLGVGLGVSLLDPLNVASAFIPVVGQTRIAAALARQNGRIGRAMVRARVGAVEGAVGAAVVEPIILGAAAAEQADYDMTDSLLNIAFGTVLGGGLHAGIGALGDRSKARQISRIADAMDRADFQNKEANLRSSVSQLATGRRVDLSPIAGDFTPVRVVDERVAGEPAVEAAPDVYDVARELDPGFMARIDNLARRKQALRDEIAGLDPQRSARAETAVSDIDAEIGDLTARLETETKRNQKKLRARIEKLQETRDQVYTESIGGDTPEMSIKRRHLAEIDEIERNLVPQLSKLLRRAETEIGTRGASQPAPAEQYEYRPRFVRDGTPGALDAAKEDIMAKARATHGSDRHITANHEALREVTERVNAASGRSEAVAVEDELSMAADELSTIEARLGVEAGDFSVNDKIIQSMDDMPAALEAMRACQMRG